MSARIAAAILWACLMPAWMASAEEPADPVPEDGQSLPAETPSSGGTPGSERPLPPDASTRDAGLGSFEPSETIPADSAVAFPADI